MICKNDDLELKIMTVLQRTFPASGGGLSGRTFDIWIVV